MKIPRWTEFAADLMVEVDQAYEQGLDFDQDLAKKEVEAILALADRPERETKALAFHEWIAGLSVREEYPYEEPSDWAGIRATLRGVEEPRALPPTEELKDRVLGAWFGRIAGCLLGKPFEGWRSERYYSFLRESGQFPLSQYASFDLPADLRKKYDKDIDTNENLRNISRERISRMIEDDDTNYTVLGLKLLAEKGNDFSSDDVAGLWLNDLPFGHVCTAERIAYRNLVRLIPPPETASYANPYREWIGAQIRADVFGYANPGNPMQAAEMAWRDASISHVKNGIYGEMYIAAAISLALVENDIATVLRAALDYIPPKSRLHEAICQAFRWYETMAFEEAYETFHCKWDEHDTHHWHHTISNAQIVVLSLLYGAKDFGNTICRAVDLLLDTDCNGATAGSILGAVIGERQIPADWKKSLNNTLETAVAGYNEVCISEMAERTLELINK